MELRRQNWEAARRAKPVIAEVYKEFNKIFGERYSNPYFAPFMTDDAEIVLLGLGAVAMPARTAVRRLREQGQKVGYVNLRWFRPFPTTELRELLGRFKGVGIIDRDCAHGSPDSGGILFHDVRSCVYPLNKRPVMSNFIGGLGGRDISIEDCIKMFDLTRDAADKGSEDVNVTWIGLRE
jgi:pyruvate ferredoxin oxidoreductase alpha subunit